MIESFKEFLRLSSELSKLTIKVNKTVNINDLIVDCINEDYGWATFGNTQVIMMLKNGYINATQLCKSGNKQFRNWLSNEQSKLLIESVESDINDAATILITGGNNALIRGTYVHPDIIVHVGSWISVEFAKMVSKIVLNYFAEQNLKKYKQEIQEKDAAIVKMQNTMDTLFEQNNVLMKQNAKLLSVNNDLKNINLDQTNKIDELLGYSKTMNNKLDYIKHNYVVDSKPCDMNMFVLLRNNAGPYMYTVIRCMHKSYFDCYTRHLKKYPRAEKILELVDPYANNLWNRVKDHVSIDSKYASFNILQPYDENNLLADIKKNADIRFEF